MEIEQDAAACANEYGVAMTMSVTAFSNERALEADPLLTDGLTEDTAEVSLSDVFGIMRNRFEGTPYSPDETGRIDMRVIGTDTSLSVHVLQIYPDLPAKMSVLTWESLAPAVYGVFVPFSNLCTEVSEPYGADQPDSAGQSFDTAHYAWYALKCLNTIGLQEPRVYGAPVAEYWKQAEEGMLSAVPYVLETISGLLETDPDYAASGMTDYCSYLQQNAFADAQSMLNTLLWFLNFNSNTMKIVRNPETNELTGEERVLSPVPITLSPKAYYTVFSMADGVGGDE